MNQPHILFVYKQFPAPAVGHAGGESLFRLMAGLHSRGFKVSLVARILENEKSLIPSVESICDSVYTTPHFRALPGSKIKTIPQSYLALRKLTKRAIEDIHPDLLHVETTQTATALLGLRRPPASYRTQDVNWFLYEQRLSRITGLKRIPLHGARLGFRCLESLLCKHYDIILAISKGDQRLLQPMCGDKPCLLVSLGTPMPTSITRHPPQSSPNLVFVGDMSRTLNVEGILWFLNGIWPIIQETLPETNLHIVGRQPPPELKCWDDDEHIMVTGFVEDLTVWYEKATLFISPLLVAGGLLQKILDAMWLGVPVVATSVCNHGLGAKSGVEIVTADTELTFAQAVIKLLSDPVERYQLAMHGQAFVKRNYDVEPSLDHWADDLKGLITDNHYSSSGNHPD